MPTFLSCHLSSSTLFVRSHTIIINELKRLTIAIYINALRPKAG